MPTASARCFALVPCAGVGARAGAGGPKQYAPLAGRAVVAHTLAALARVPRLAATLVVLAPDDAQFEAACPAPRAERGWVARCGGATRAATVANGLAELRAAARAPTTGCWCTTRRAAWCAPTWVDRLIDACLRRPRRRPARAAAGRHAEAGATAAASPRTLDRARQVGGADAADVPPGPAARGAGAGRRRRHRRGQRDRGAGPCAAAGAGRAARTSRSPGRPTSRWPSALLDTRMDAGRMTPRCASAKAGTPTRWWPAAR